MENANEVIENLKNKGKENTNINNSDKEYIYLENLGQIKKISQDELDTVLDHLPETIFQLKNCVFRVSYVHKEKGRFTCEIMNLKS